MYVDLSAFVDQALSKITTSSTFKLVLVKFTTILTEESSRKIRTGLKDDEGTFISVHVLNSLVSR